MSDLKVTDAEVRKAIKKFTVVRQETIDTLEKLAEYLDGLSSSTNVAKLAGGGVAISSGLIGLACLVAIPFTGGLSFLGSLACAGTGLAGGTTLVIADVIKSVNENAYVKEAEQALKIDRENTKTFYERLHLDEVIKAGKVVGGTSKGVAFIGRIATVIGKKALTRGGYTAVNALKTVSALGKVAKFAGPVLSVVFLPFDIADVVSTAIDTSNGSVNAAASDIRKIVDALKDELKTVKSDPDYKSLVH
ncbi:apolipoprotein L3-like [Mytilus galloprovincialis]|uniref:apolipoprotein L3-like n=1 Tax=Mytilus galloprovincialis TaxID=29158 RepID=UPI003F7BDBCF